jgi:glucokinase
MQTALGIDIGGTHCRAAIVGAPGRILAQAEAATPEAGDPQRLAKALAALAAKAIENAPKPPSSTTVGVVLPGIWDRATGVMQRAVNLPALDGANVRGLFEAALDCPVRLETDVIAAAWAQYRCLTPQPRRFVYLSLGTGVGGCAILDGEILRHTRGGAGHFGHLIVDTSPGAPICRCGARGCLEAVVSGGLAGTWHRGDEPQRPVGTPGMAADALATGLLQISHFYAPDTIALGGGVIDHNPELLSETRAAFEQKASSLVPEGMRIEKAPLPTNEAGAIGAALLAMP